MSPELHFARYETAVRLLTSFPGPQHCHIGKKSLPNGIRLTEKNSMRCRELLSVTECQLYSLSQEYALIRID